jgi:hypothetical protein
MANGGGQGDQSPNRRVSQTLEELKVEKIDLTDVFVAGALVEKLPSPWNDYKQQLKHKHTHMSLISSST